MFAPLTPPVQLPASSNLVAKIGRFNSPVSGQERCSWSGSAVELRVHGSHLSFSLIDKGDNYLEWELDGVLSGSIHLRPEDQQYSIDFPLGDHEIRLVKRTESFVGTVTYKSFVLGDSGRFLKPKPPTRLIEFVGDSITCGYGNEGASEKENFKTSTENADLSYAWIASRSLNAKASIIAWSGRKMWPDNTVPSLYDLIIPDDPSTKYDFSTHPKPDVVLINLATNDFGRGNPDRAGWCNAYEAFIAKLRKLYPRAEIYCAIGSMMSDQYPPNQKALTTVRSYIDEIVEHEKSIGDGKVGKLEFAMQKQSDGLGSNYHPSVKTDTIMAETLAVRIRKDLGW